MGKIIWSDFAKEDLKEILAYISKDSPKYAQYFRERLFEKVKYLNRFPQMGRIIPESKDPNKRELIFQNYRIVYTIEEDTVEIITILHGSRLFRL